MGFDLIVSAANLLRDRDGKLKATSDRLLSVRHDFPIGVILDIVLGERQSVGAAIEEFKFVLRSFGYPGELTTLDNAIASTKRPPQARRHRCQHQHDHDGSSP